MSKKTIVCLVFFLVGTVIFTSNTLAVSEDSKVREDIEELEKEQEQLHELMRKIGKLLEEKGLKEIRLTYDESKRMIGLNYDNDETKQQYEEELGKDITSIAEEIGFKNIKVNWRKIEHKLPNDRHDNEWADRSQKIINKIYGDFKKSGYTVTSISIDLDTVTIIVDEPKESFDGKKKQAYLIADTSIEEVTDKKYDVIVKRESDQKKTEKEWQPIILTVEKIVSRKFEEYRGFAYSFHPEPLQIIIKTDLEKPFVIWEWLFYKEYGERINEIIHYVDEVIQLKQEELQVDAIPYEIIIRGKNNKRLN